MATSTYGVGAGSEPSRDIPGGPTAESVNTKSGEDGDYCLTDQFEGNMPGGNQVTSTVPGMASPHTFDEAITGERVSYVGNNARISSAGNASTMGTWPIQGNEVWAGPTKTLGDEFPQDVGAQDNMNKV